LIHQYGAWIVFALVFLESIGLPLPGEAILVSAAIFAGTTHDLSIALVLVSAMLGGDIGHHHRLLDRRSVRISAAASLRLLHRP
jgi:membrane protein DedA with SNARE-associated domain